MFKTVFITALVLVPLHCAAQDSAPAMPLDAQEQQDHVRNALSALEQMKQAMEEMVRLKTAQCMKAVGIPNFCDCIANHTPVAIDFQQYVTILSHTKEDLKYDVMTPDDKKTVDNARTGRDVCVTWYGKASVSAPSK